MENNNGTEERKGFDWGKFNWNKLALILILAGLGFVAVAWLSGARGGAIAFAGGRFHVVQDSGAEFTPIPRTREISYISVNATAATIIIETTPPGETDGVHFLNIEPDTFEISDGKILIDSRPTERRLYFFNVNTARREIRINLPAGTALSEIEANATSGGIRLFNLQASEISAAVTSGSVRGENLDFVNAYLRTVSGTVNVSDITWQTLHAQSTSGSVRVYGGEVRGTDEGFTRLQSTSGSVNLELRGNREDFHYDLSTSSGTVRVDGMRHGRSLSSGRGQHSITMRATSGGVRLSFTD